MKVFAGLLITFLLFLTACFKPTAEEDDKTLRCNGTLTDASTHAPLKDIPLTIYTQGGTLDDYVNGLLYVDAISYVHTDESGKFSISLYKDNFKIYNLGCPAIPEGYQPYFRLNGGPVYDLYLNPDDFYDQNYTRFSIGNNQIYTMELFPVASYRLALPVLTAEQKQCKLILKIPGLFGIIEEKYALYNASDLLHLKSVRPLIAANYASGSYELVRDSVIKSGAFHTFCVPHDTTEVLLEL